MVEPKGVTPDVEGDVYVYFCLREFSDSGFGLTCYSESRKEFIIPKVWMNHRSDAGDAPLAFQQFGAECYCGARKRRAVRAFVCASSHMAQP